MAVTTARRKAHAPPAQQLVAQRRAQAKHQGASLPAYLQRKLALGQTGDAYEVEADRVADQVVAGSAAGPAMDAGGSVQRVPADEKKQDAKKPEDKAQKADADKKDTKKPDDKPDAKKAQKADADKKDAKKPDDKPDAKKAQKADADKKDAKKPDDKKEKAAVQKKEINADAKIAEEKKKKGPAVEAKTGDTGPEHDAASASHPETGSHSDKDALQKADAGQSSSDKKKDDQPAKAQKQSLASGITRVQAQSLQNQTLQAKSDAGGSVPGDVEHRIDATRGGGAPLPADTRSEMESQFGTDFGGVNIHTGSEAQGLASELNAKAFTVGNDVYFNNGAFAPETQEGKHLLAHELTHVVQQGGSAGGIQRALNPAPSPAHPKNSDSAKALEDLEKLRVPASKQRHLPLYDSWASAGKLKRKAGYDRQKPDQKDSVWLKKVQVKDDALESNVKDLPTNPAKAITLTKGGKKLLRAKNRDELKKKLQVPTWSRAGKATTYNVDHIIELQVSGGDGEGVGNSIENMELFDSSTNFSSGAALSADIKEKARVYLETIQSTDVSKKNVAKFLKQTDITFTSAVGGGGGKSEAGSSYWTKTEIENAEPAKDMVVDLDKSKGSDKSFLLRSGLGGMTLAAFSHTPKQLSFGPGGGANAVAGLTISKITLSEGYDTVGEGDSIGSLTATWDLPTDFKANGSITLPLMSSGDYSGFIGKIPKLTPEFKHLCPVDFSDISINEDGLSSVGILKPQIPLLSKVAISVGLRGRDVEFRADYDLGNLDLKLPGITLDDASIGVFFGSSGFGADGSVDFSLGKLATGSLSAKASSESGLSVKGSLSFRADYFKNSRIELSYADEKFSGSGTITLAEDKVKGIKKASATVKVDGDQWSATGTVEPDVPGVESGNMSISFSADKGMTISGDLILKKMPGISDGKLSAELQEAGDRYKLKASGTVNLCIPDLPASITATYDDGQFTASLSVAYAKGMLKGSLTVGLTNQAVGDDGKPAGDPGKDLTVFGNGSMTIQIAPWLQGTVAITLLPTGKLKVYGEVALPSTLDVFPEKRFDKELLSIGIDIPIVGVSVAGQRVGVFATIGGNLALKAGVGPGQLRNVKLGIDYTPGEEDKTHVTGSAEFHVPADAGLRLAITGGIGAGIPIISATAGLEIGATAGVKAEANIGATVDWTPGKGLVLEGKAEAKAQPAFAFDVTGFVKVEADLLIDTINLYEKRWQLAAFEYGSGMEIGLELPVRYEEGKPFNPSIDDVKFTYPDIDPMGMLGGLIKSI